MFLLVETCTDLLIPQSIYSGNAARNAISIDIGSQNSDESSAIPPCTLCPREYISRRIAGTKAVSLEATREIPTDVS